ncbi:unnamed protein product [Moneuplotes crassus]|uniref:B box-type domain-containing protein n=2 Tax=Euplotes crassus TaxID=5936 RepID=A0AAD1UCB8_EUPCR|nr:unnamed protein product [Moneuplotes crassus]
MDPQDESTFCAECNNCPEDILVLICNHNLCLPCASKNLKRESDKSQHTFQTVVCTECGLATVLDPESATTLISMYHEIEEDSVHSVNQSKNYKEVSSPPQESLYTRDLPKQSHDFRDTFHAPPVQSTVSQESEMTYCTEHPDEMVNYYCFECNVATICAECVIHGSHKGHDVQTLRKAYPLICSKLEDLKGSVNSKIEELIQSQQKLDSGKKEILSQVSSIKKRISDTVQELKENIDRKEQELLKEADEFQEQNTKQVDHLLRLANGRAMNLSEHIQTIKQALTNYDFKTACNFYSKKFSEINESSDTEIPQLESISRQAKNKFQIKSQNINDIIESLQNFKLNLGGLNLKMNPLEDISNKRQAANFEERPKETQGLPQNLFELGYKANSSLKTSVAKTMNKIKQNFVDDSPQDHQFYDPKPTKGPSFRNTSSGSIQREHVIYGEEEDDYEFMYK